MVLDPRLKKLATGVPAQEVARAHAKSLIPGENLTDVEQQMADEFRATLEAMFLMAAVDGEISKEEMDQLAASIQAVVDMHTLGDLELGRTLDDLNAKLARDGWHARLQAVGARIKSEEGKAFAFRLAAGVAFVDDHVAHAEAAAIDALAARLGLDPDDSQSILREVQNELFGG
jgi:uncharacterized membrane protein YebE (DUF533 family)